MLIELFVFFEIVMLAFFATAFFTKNEILWTISLVLTGFLMFSGFTLEVQTYVYNSSINAYQYQIISQYYPYLTGINMIFFVLGIVLMLYDLWSKLSLSNAEE